MCILASVELINNVETVIISCITWNPTTSESLIYYSQYDLKGNTILSWKLLKTIKNVVNSVGSEQTLLGYESLYQTSISTFISVFPYTNQSNVNDITYTLSYNITKIS